MPIRPPALDDRDFAALVDELLDRVSAHTPEWSPRLGDPGRTMIELFAWLADTLLYRANLIPERQRLAFLRLLGVGLRPAIPASGLVSIGLDPKKTEAVSLSPFATVKGPVSFETQREITVLPVTGQTYYKRSLTTEEKAAFTDIEAALSQIYDAEQATPYVTTPQFAQGQAEPIDLVAQAIDECLWIALLAPQPELVDAVRETLGRTNADGQSPLINVGAVPLIQMPDRFFGPDALKIGPRARLPFTWEMSTGQLNTNGQPTYVPLQTVTDSTQGLTQPGVFRFSLPAPAFIGSLSNDVQTDPFAGTGDRPPRLDDPETDARLVTWIRLRPTEALAHFELSWVGVNAVEIDQRQTVRDRVIGTSDGSANPSYALPGQSVDPETLVVEVDEPDLGYRPWRMIEDLALAGRDDKVFQLDAEAGTVTFGDGLRGQRLPVGRRIRIARMRAGGSSEGNLPPGSLTEISAVTLRGAPAGKLTVQQPIATTGGAAAEDLASAEQRIPAMLRHRDRAVTATDYQQLTADTPGVRVGRVEVLPRFRPTQVPTQPNSMGELKAPDMPGVVSVMVLPYRATAAAPNPRPDRPFLETVHAHLESRRPLGTELYVIGCQYRPLGLSVGVELLDGFNRDSVLLAVRTALFDFLWPLSPGDLTGQGWRLGKTVRDRELETVVARVDGVRSVDRVNLFTPVTDGWAKVENPSQPSSVDLAIAPWELPELLAVVVTEGPTPEDLTSLPPGNTTDLGLGVPVVMEVC
ncbi:MAG: putative baseplate assembly protein [Cyanobacteria bacterium P01_H01_bin.162]